MPPKVPLRYGFLKFNTFLTLSKSAIREIVVPFWRVLLIMAISETRSNSDSSSPDSWAV